MRTNWYLLLTLVSFTGPAIANTTEAVKASQRPMARGELAALAEAMTTPVTNPNPGKGTSKGFQDWLTDFRKRALAKGIAQETLDKALKDISFNPSVVHKDQTQSEFTKTIWDYLDTATSDLRVKNGKQAVAKWKDTLEKIEKEYQVEKEVIAAIWGLESAYGALRGEELTINSLASLAYDARRTEFFEGELIAALTILQNGDVPADQMKGSWAGAMGHTQFMPTSFLRYAVDYDKNGKRNIWSDDPSDALASTGAYLKEFGWTYGQPWGIEVKLPDDFDYLMADRAVKKNPSEWAKLGVVDLQGNPVDDFGESSVLLPGGAEGAAFLIFDNFKVLEKYNSADAYVIGVGHLGDRIDGGGKIHHSWPRQNRALTYDERIELQTRLTAAGFDTQKIDAKIGPLTIDAVRNFQKSKGLVPDGYASLTVLERLRTEKP